MPECDEAPGGVLLDEDQAATVVANLLVPWRKWLVEYQRAVAKGDHGRADLCLERIERFDRMIAKVRAQGERDWSLIGAQGASSPVRTP